MVYKISSFGSSIPKSEKGDIPTTGKCYKKIRGNKNAKEFIKWALKIDPKERALIMDLAFHDFLKDELCLTMPPESVFDTATVLENIIYYSKESDNNKRKAGEQGGDGTVQTLVGGGLDGDQVTATVTIKDLKAKKRKLEGWWNMMDARMQAEAEKLKAK
ncbi:hypothetical protein BG015_007061 [Linnemannia schmuckeri]|uniref:Uncharacterized protein n=1 Tax=Linnemannia schmuckeri TaxID=64567 RepID=A0A9P5S9S3_9FUNG|nr:hypothetical protein BG015_007061 [Linnemannia schmuckeri]